MEPSNGESISRRDLLAGIGTTTIAAVMFGGTEDALSQDFVMRRKFERWYAEDFEKNKTTEEILKDFSPQEKHFVGRIMSATINELLSSSNNDPFMVIKMSEFRERCAQLIQELSGRRGYPIIDAGKLRKVIDLLEHLSKYPQGDRI